MKKIFTFKSKKLDKVFSAKGFSFFLTIIGLFIGNHVFAQLTQVIQGTSGVYTWTCPSGVTSIQVECWGGGGAGGGTVATTSPTANAGGGGAGGSYVKHTSVTVVPGTVYSYTVGAGGTGVSVGNGNSGGNTTFNSTTIIAYGGGGGSVGTITTSAGGTCQTPTTGTVNYAGGSGGAGKGSTGYYSGGGGGGADSGGAGHDASNSTITGGAAGSSGGGAGGAGISATGAIGNAGSAAGGGGAGSTTGQGNVARAGGAGAPGKIILTYTLPGTPTLSFATPTSVTKNYGDAAFSNVATSSNSQGAITYSSSNTSVATVNSSTGLVTILSTGSAVITATIAAYGDYVSGSTSYTLTVNQNGAKYTGLTSVASDGTSPTSIFDGNYTTRWQDGSNLDAAWITVNLGSVKNVNSIKIYWEAANARAYNIQVSTDNSNWTTIATKTGMAAGNRTDIISGLNSDCQYIRMQGVTRQLAYGYSIFEFEVYPAMTPMLTTLTVSPSTSSIVPGANKQLTAGGLDQIGNAFTLTGTTTWSVSGSGASIDSNGLFSSTQKGLFTVTATNSGISQTATVDVLPSNTDLSYVSGVSATATASSGTASLAFDNNSGSRWESAASDPQWIMVNLGGIKSVTDFHITWETASSKDYIIEGSLNGTDWSTIISKTNMPAGPRTDRLYDLSATAQYVRLTATSRNTVYGHSIYEFQIYGSSLLVPNLAFATSGTVTKNYGDAAFTNAATSTNSSGAITYSSNNTSIATVNANTGQVTIVSAGSAVITATIAASGTYSSTTATYTVTVNGVTPNLGFATPTSVTKNYGDAAFINAASSTNSAGSITYSSGNTSVATVNASTGEVTIVAAGTAVITATIAANLGYISTSATYTLTVVGVNPDLNLSVTGTLNKKLGDAVFTNSATSSNSSGAISYGSDNTGVATVNSSSGQVTIIGVGTAVITATIAANGGFTSRSVSYTVVVKYPIGSIKGTSVPLYTQGALGGDVNTPYNTANALIDYKVVTENGKSWIYTKFTGTSALDLDASWMSQFRYWSVANAKTENNLTVSRNASTKVVLGKATTTIPASVRISFFQSIVGTWQETLITSYTPTTSNSPINGDATAPVVSACDAVTTTTAATLTITGSDNSGDLFYHIEDATHSINEFAFQNTFVLTGLTEGVTYNLSVTPVDFTGNEGSSFAKQVTTGSGVNIMSNMVSSNIQACPTCNYTISNGAELTIDGSTTIQDVIVAAGSKITVQHGSTLTAGTLTLNSNASGTSTFIDNGTSAITSATVNQYLTAGRNWYISSPVTNAASGVFGVADTNNKLYWYDEAHASTSPWLQISATDATLTPVKGYVVNMASDGAVSFTGILNNGTQSITVYRTTGQVKEGFNLVGNPYPSYLDWDQVTATNLLTSIWQRTKNGSNVYVFDTYNSLGQMGIDNSGRNVNNHIPPMQAFWVRVTNGSTSGNLTLNNSMRSHKGSQTVSGRTVTDPVFKTATTKTKSQEVLRLQVTTGSNTDETVIYSDDQAANNYDGYDSPKMFGNSSAVAEIYTVVDQENLSINGLNAIPYNTEIQLGFVTANAGVFSIKASQVSNFPAGTQVILKDYQQVSNPIITDLTDGSVYSFTSDAVTSNTTRFAVIFKTSSAITGNVSATNESAWISVSSGKIIVNGLTEKSTLIEVYNALGQRIINSTVSGKTGVSLDGIPSGTYVVKLSESTNILTQKVVVH